MTVTPSSRTTPEVIDDTHVINNNTFQGHTFIAGITGSGKTYYASRMFRESKRFALFINTNSEREPEIMSDVLVHDVDGVIEAINRYGKQHICYTPPADSQITNEDLITIIDLLFQMGVQINPPTKKNILTWCEIYIDEIQTYEAKRPKIDSRFSKIWKRGRRYGIRGIAISQRPADVSQTVLTQSRTHVIFQLGMYERSYFEAYRIPAFDEETEAWLEKDYHYVTLEQKGDIELHEPI